MPFLNGFLFHFNLFCQIQNPKATRQHLPRLNTGYLPWVWLRLRHGKRVRKTSDVFGERRQLDYGQKKRRKKCGTPGEASNKNEGPQKTTTTTQPKNWAQDFLGEVFFLERGCNISSFFFNQAFLGIECFSRVSERYI